MLKNIKSDHFIKILFSFLFEKDKLEIIKYNKSLQNILDINIINYKFFQRNLYNLRIQWKRKRMLW